VDDHCSPGFSVNSFSFFIGTAVNMDLGAGAAGAGIAHLPEIIFFAKWQDAVPGNNFFPFIVCFFIFGKSFFFIAFKNGYV
jgi:hypothetical protein